MSGVIVPQLLCARCKQSFPATTEYFSYKGYAWRSGYYSYCRKCEAEYAKERRKKDPEKFRAINRASRKRHPETKNAASKRYYVKHREEVRERHKRYHARTKARYAERTREWMKKNPEKATLSRITNYNNRRARKNNLADTLTTEQWLNAVDYFHGCCAVCGRQGRDLLNTHRLAADHWIPLSKDGATTAENIVPLCHGVDGCNNSKRDKMPLEWLTLRFGRRKAKTILAKVETYFRSLS